MTRIITLTLIIHLLLNGLLMSAYKILLDDTTRQAVELEIEKVKGWLK